MLTHCDVRYVPVKARANVGVGVGGRVIRVQVGEAVIGPVIRITANLEAAHYGNLCCYSKYRWFFPSFLRVTFRGNFPISFNFSRMYPQSVDPVNTLKHSLSGASLSYAAL